MANIERIKGADENDSALLAGRKATEILINNKGKNTLFLYSGGSAIKVLDYIRTEVFGPHLTISPLDDRYTTDQARSNCLKFMQTHFYSVAKSAGSIFISSVPEGSETRDQVAGRLDQTINSWLSANPEGPVVAIVGMGPDGHTAGIMPYPHEEELFQNLFVKTTRNFLGYDAGHRNPMPERITATVPFLTLIDEVVFYACGAVKKRALDEAFNPSTSLSDLPAAIITRMKKVTVITDIA